MPDIAPLRLVVWRVVLCILAIAGAMISLPSSAQEVSFDEPERWIHFTPEFGLPEGPIHAVAETPTAVWVATDHVVAWFDEFRWHPMLVDSALLSLHLPSWIASDLRGGVVVVWSGALYRGNETGLTKLPPLRDATLRVRRAVPLDSNRVLVLASRSTEEPASLFILADDRIEPLAPPGDIPGGTRSANQLWRTDAGRVWLNSSTGLSYWGGESWVLAHSAISSEQELLALWESPDGQGVLSFRGPSSQWGLWEWSPDEPLTRVSSEGEQHVVNLLGSGQGGEVVAFHETGHVRARGASGWAPVDPLPDELRRATFFASRPNGDAWIGTLDGLSLYVRSFTRWSILEYPFGDARNWTNEIMRSRDGALWMATLAGVLRREDNAEEVWFQAAAGHSMAAMTGLAEDDSGRIWASSGGQLEGVLRWDGTRWSYLAPTELDGARRIHRLESDEAGRVWMMALGDSAGGGGLYVSDEGRVARWERRGYPTGRRVYSWTERPEGTVWVGTEDRLSRWRDGEWTHWPKGDGWSGRSIFTMAVDADQRLWFSDRDEGLLYVDEDDRIQSVTTEGDLEGKQVWEVTVDGSGRLWATTDRGLSTLRDGVWSSFYPPGGLTNARLWPVLPLEDEVLIGSLGSGVAVLNRANEAAQPPRVMIEPPATSDRSGSIRWSAHARGGSPSPGAIPTRYRLEDDTWSPWSLTRKLSFEGLRTGTRTLTVQAMGPFGQVNEPGPTEEFTIRPTITTTVQVLLAVLGTILLVFSVMGIVRKRRHDMALRLEIEERKRAEEALEERLKFEEVLAKLSTEFVGLSVDQIGRGIMQGLALLGEAMEADRCQLLFSSDATVAHRTHEWCREGVPALKDLDAGLDGVNFPWAQATLAQLKPMIFDGLADIPTDAERLKAYLESVGVYALIVVPFAVGGPSQGAITLAKIGPKGRRHPWRWDVVSRVRLVGDVFANALSMRQAEEEKDALEMQLWHAQKLEAVGQLTGGVAHDFNNLLTVIIGNLELMEYEWGDEDGLLRSLAGNALDAASRGAILTRRLLAFARRQSLQPKAIDTYELLVGLDALLRRTLGETIEIDMVCNPDLWTCQADPTQLEHVILNLAINARDAMPEGGALSVRCSNSIVDETTVSGSPDLKSGEYVALAVTDTGEGMSPETVERAFEPFFTTKEVGRGSGLGLSMVYGFVKQSGGHVSIESELGIGTTVRVLLPRAERTDEAVGESPPGDPAVVDSEPSAPAEATPRGSGERILLVEDDPSVRELTLRMLRELGYDAIAVGDGPAGMEILRERDDVDLLLTDVVLPKGMSGLELAGEAKRLHPFLKVLCVSGHPEHPTFQAQDPDSPTEIMSKPFTRAGLAQRLVDLLEPL